MPLAAWRENSSRHVASLRRIRLLFFIAPVSSTITGRDYPQWTDLRKYVAELPVTAQRLGGDVEQKTIDELLVGVGDGADGGGQGEDHVVIRHGQEVRLRRSEEHTSE